MLRHRLELQLVIEEKCEKTIEVGEGFYDTVSHALEHNCDSVTCVER